MTNHVSIEHCPEFEFQVPFIYPTDNIPYDIKEMVEAYAKDVVRKHLAETVRRLLILLDGEENPQIVLEALLHNNGCTLDSDGVMSHVARKLKISRQRFHHHTKTVKRKVELRLNTNKNSYINK